MPPKKRNRKRAPNRTSTRRPVAETVRARPQPGGIGAESNLADLAAKAGVGEDFGAELREAVDARNPLALLNLASSILSVLDPGTEDTPSIAGGQSPGQADGRPRPGSRAQGGDVEGGEAVSVSVFADALLSAGVRQTHALASVIGAMSGDDLLQERIRREVRSRRLPMPGWVKRLDQTKPTRATAMTHPFADGESVAVEVDLPDDRVFLVLAYVDHNLGTAVTDAFTLEDNLDHVLKHWHGAGRSGAGEDEDLPLAQARARLTDAIETGAAANPPLVSETWPRCRPLVEWVISMMPPGGTGYERPKWSEEDRADLIDRFARSPQAADLSADEVTLADLFIDFATGHGSGDLLRWSPTSVELLLEWLPGTTHAPPARFDAAPKVLRAFVLFSHAERGIAPDLTSQTLASIEAHAPGFHENIGSGQSAPSAGSAEWDRRRQEIALRREVPRRGFPHASPGGAR